MNDFIGVLPKRRPIATLPGECVALTFIFGFRFVFVFTRLFPELSVTFRKRKPKKAGRFS
jgi:hypothetical protein